MPLLRLILLAWLCCPLSALAQQQAESQPEQTVQPEQAAQTAQTKAQPLQAEAAPTTAEPVVQTPVADKTNPMAAKATASSERPTGGLGLGKMALSLGIVVAIVIVLGWVFKKLTLRLPGSKHIKIISSMPLGPKERLLVIEMQGKQRVLGVTAHSINLLFELENSLPEEKLASDFHTQLQSFLKK